MHDDQTSNSEYQKGYNEGYLITKHLPDIAGKISAVKSIAPRMEGFQDGRKEYVLEQIRTYKHEQSNIQHDIGKGKDQQKDNDIDRD